MYAQQSSVILSRGVVPEGAEDPRRVTWMVGLGSDYLTVSLKTAGDQER